MQKIVGTKITLTRGDTLKAIVTMLRPDGTEYIPEAGDHIRFAMKKHFTDPDSETLIEKVIPNDTLMLHLEPEDTKQYPFGSYVYDIQLTHANGDIDTFIDRAQIDLSEEVK